jgi:hypothetical protein
MRRAFFVFKSLIMARYRRLLSCLFVALLVWVAIYIVNSYNGGYDLKFDSHRVYDPLEGTFKYSVEMKWRPFMGRSDSHGTDVVGAVFSPLISLDRRFVHRSIDVNSDEGLRRVKELPLDLVHPSDRDKRTKGRVVAGTDTL